MRFLVAALVALVTLIPPPAHAGERETFKRELVQQIERRSGVDLRRSRCLHRIAREHVLTLRHRQWSEVEHLGLEDAARCRSHLAGEVLGLATRPASLVNNWMDSPTHRRVLRNRSYNHVGIALAPYEGGYLVSVVFADEVK